MTTPLFRCLKTVRVALRASLFALLVCLAPVTQINAQGVIQYQVVDLVDEAVGEDLWQYTYQLSGFTFAQGEGFSVFFDHVQYANLHQPQPVAGGLWDVLVVQPDGILQQPGYFDALALVGSPATVLPFSVRFTWLGSGSPGDQPFEQYDSSFQTTGTGSSVVPEPGSLTVLLSGVVVWLWRRSLRTGRKFSLS